MIRALNTLLLTLLTIACATAQTTRVRGRVTDSSTKQPIPFASVMFPGTVVGITTDENGIYALETRDTVSRLSATFMGYEPMTKSVKVKAYNNIDFELKPASFDIDQVVVTPGENPAHPILKEVRRRRAQNDQSLYDRYICETYTKMQLDLTKVKPFRSKRLQRNLGFIFDYVDTSALSGEAYLPVMISETSGELYRSREHSLQKEVIRANRVSGVDESFSIAQFTGQMEIDVNFYDNFIELFNVRFASPLAESGLSFYNYFLIDSLNINGRKTYKIRFHPKRLATPVLDGEIHIDSATYALQSASVRMPKGVNVNWVKHLKIENENRIVDSTRWFRSKDRMAIEFSIVQSDSSKINSFIASREIAYTNVRFDEPIPEEVIKMGSNINLSQEDVTQNNESYWQSVRPYELTPREKAIYTMVDSVQGTPIYRNIYTIVNAIIGGYYNTKYIGIGPYYKLLSFNDLEGVRTQIGLRTTSNVSRRWRLMGYVGYGFKDTKVKGGGTFEYMFKRSLTHKLTLTAKHDVVQLGAGYNALSESNILSSIFSRGGEHLSMVDMAELNYEHEWRHGISTTFNLLTRSIHSNRFVPMLTLEEEWLRRINDYSVSITGRFSKDETIYRQIFDKKYQGSQYPVTMINVKAGIADVNREYHPYLHLEGGIHYKPKIPPIGYSDITIKGGHIFGSVPYHLLKLQEGNGTYFYDPYAFSCMNYYEFASDSWVALFYEHHFNGWLLGRIPLLKRLKWREVFLFKGVWGVLSDRNNPQMVGSSAPLMFPLGMSEIGNTPYMEIGAGIENILNLFRVDCIWRLTHRDSRPGQKVSNFAVNLSVKLTF